MVRLYKNIMLHLFLLSTSLLLLISLLLRRALPGLISTNLSPAEPLKFLKLSVKEECLTLSNAVLTVTLHLSFIPFILKTRKNANAVTTILILSLFKKGIDIITINSAVHTARNLLIRLNRKLLLTSLNVETKTVRTVFSPRNTPNIIETRFLISTGIITSKLRISCLLLMTLMSRVILTLDSESLISIFLLKSLLSLLITSYLTVPVLKP